MEEPLLIDWDQWPGSWPVFTGRQTFVCMDVWCLVSDQKIDDIHVAKAGREEGRSESFPVTNMPKVQSSCLIECSCHPLCHANWRLIIIQWNPLKNGHYSMGLRKVSSLERCPLFSGKKVWSLLTLQMCPH